MGDNDQRMKREEERRRDFYSSLPTECCHRCKYEYSGSCRRYPATVIVQTFSSRTGEITSRQPTVYANGWCGEWKDKYDG